MIQTWFTFPQIDPIAIQLGPFAIRWYALAYIVGLLAAWRILAKQAGPKQGAPFTKQQLDQLLNLSVLGIILGGRLGYVLFYNPAYYLSHPIDILKVWQGGMSFHGGFLGVVLAAIFFCRRHKLHLMAVSDRIASVAPIGLFFGRISNFINGELYGRATDLPIGMVFPHGGPLARHPSQLYEAAFEGLFLGLIMWHQAKHGAYQKPAYLTGVFSLGYGLARWFVEYTRQPDAHIGFLANFSGLNLTMGQLLSLPMILAGLYLIYYARRSDPRNSDSSRSDPQNSGPKDA